MGHSILSPTVGATSTRPKIVFPSQPPAVPNPVVSQAAPNQFTNTPLVFLQPVNPGAVTFTLTSVANNGFTITASTSNSLTVNYEVMGNSY